MASDQKTAGQQLAGFVGKFSPAHRTLIRAARAALRRRFPTANEMVYDNYNFFVIGYGPGERPSECFLSIAAAANGVGLCFLHGTKLPDPEKILLGSGRQTRFLRLESPAVLRRPAIGALLDAAAARCQPPLPTEGRGRLIIRSISAKQRPRQSVPQTRGTRPKTPCP